jgi:glyoxylase-like metal-dependent hydrolase (beta-lactamase superfamily II)
MSKTELNYQVHTSGDQSRPPGRLRVAGVGRELGTLIYGKRDAVLVDTFFTLEHSAKLADQVAATGKNLTYIYVTHAHGDHFFGINMLKRRFPNVRAVALASVVERIDKRLAGDIQLLRSRFPGQVPDDPSTPERMDEGSIELEGHPLIPIETGFTDSADSTSLYVPSIGLIVAGDVVYNGIHPFLAETNAQTRREWIAALDTLEALKPRAVVAGHKIPAAAPEDFDGLSTRDRADQCGRPLSGHLHEICTRFTPICTGRSQRQIYAETCQHPRSEMRVVLPAKFPSRLRSVTCPAW